MRSSMTEVLVIHESSGPQQLISSFTETQSQVTNNRISKVDDLRTSRRMH